MHLDEDFRAWPLEAAADAALTTARAEGATWADVRISSDVHRTVTMRDGSVEDATTATDTGLGVRVICAGAWGFAASTETTPVAAAAAARRAVELARRTAPLVPEPVVLADEPVSHGDWVSTYEIDPTTVDDAMVIGRLAEWSAILASQVDHTSVAFQAAKERTFYADLAGSRTWQQRVRCQPEVKVIAVGPHGFEDMTTTLPPTARGWEYVDDPRWVEQIDALPALLVERVGAPTLPPGRYDLVIAPSNLWLTIHESVGHATEYDRVVGFEANYAGTSFATVDGLGTLDYGTSLMHITGDRTAATGLATVGWDHEGVAAQSWDIIRDGVLVGYQLDRWGAAQLGVARSNGCAFADSPPHVPLQRMPNVSLQPADAGPATESLIAGVADGLLVVGDKSWSIDMSRRNFQFTAQRFVRIRHGRLEGQVKDIAYQSDTLDFWHSMVALGGPQSYELGGALNCGKGQPGQVAAVSHGCPSAVFEGVNVLATGSTP